MAKETITINGKEVESGGKKFPKDAAIVISYHSLSRQLNDERVGKGRGGNQAASTF